MISNCVIFLMFGVIFFAGGISAKHPPGIFLTRFEAPDDFYNDESAINERVKNNLKINFNSETFKMYSKF